jgi:hypothetical protein
MVHYLLVTAFERRNIARHPVARQSRHRSPSGGAPGTPAGGGRSPPADMPRAHPAMDNAGRDALFCGV